MRVTFERANEVLAYDPETGVMRWKVTNSNRRKAGNEADSMGTLYLRVRIDRVSYSQHTIAWLLMTGQWPPHQIDHINRVKTDNRWCNLRSATGRLNSANRARRSKRGLPKGITIQSNGRFLAQCNDRGMRANLGTYDSVEEASAVYQAFASRVFGEFFFAD